MTAKAKATGLEQEVLEKLGTVIDPCSRHNGTWLSFVDLGMVEEVVDDGAGAIRVRMLLDDPVCLFMVDIQSEVRKAAESVAGVESVAIEIIGDQLWTQDRLTPETKAKIARWQAIRAERAVQRNPSSPLLQIQTHQTNQTRSEG
jgi:metal-sulfur cluster biosynthetic enzyme